jgi:uncharacterized protein (DUF488 family)
MVKRLLYSIGHGRRSAEDFITLLQKYDIAYLIDVRSVPYSRFNPQYNQKALKTFLELNGIRYVFMGDALGGRPDEPICYDVKGRPDYEIMKKRSSFKEGINRLIKAYNSNVIAAVMCSETKPESCHRSSLIANVLHENKISIEHIDENGELKNHSLLIKPVLK